MKRAPFQVLVLPFRKHRRRWEYGIFRRRARSGGYWQFIAGGGHVGERPLQAAKREAYEEAQIPTQSRYIRLKSQATIPVVDICGFQWGPNTLVLVEYCFAARVADSTLKLSHEHTRYKWVSYRTARRLLKWDSNKTALWELDVRLNRRD